MHFWFGLREVYLLGVSSLLIALAISAWGRKPTSAARTTSFAMISCALWTAGYGMLLAATDLPAMRHWYGVMIMGMTTVPTAWLLLAVAYAGHDRLLSAGHVLLFLIEPILITAIVFTNPWHLLWSTETLVTRAGNATFLRDTGGIAYWFHVGYTYLVVPLGLILLLRQLSRAGGVRRRQIIGLVIGASIPFVAEVIGTMIWNPFDPLDPTAFAFTATGIVFALVFMRRQALDMIPVASGLATENMGDGMLVLDRDNRVTYVNPAAVRIMGRSSAVAIGRVATDILPDLDTGEIVGSGKAKHHVYQVRTTPLRSARGKHRGRLLILNDVTERKRAEEAAQRRGAELEGLIKDRTAELTEANRLLAVEVEERTSAEQVVRRLARDLVSAQEEERRRISRDLHDEAGQLLNALKIWLSMLSEKAPVLGPDITDQLTKIKELTDASIERIRKVVWELRPPTLDSTGLNPTLAWLCNQYEGQNELTVQYAGTEIDDCPETVSITLYRCLQEALNNVSRHSRASNARVALRRQNGQLALTIADDGVGFTTQDESHDGMGLRGMRERVESVQGSLHVESRVGAGTTMTVLVPCASQ